MFKNKCVVIGVTGGIAAFKAAELVSMLKKQGADVHVILTAGAQKFVTPLTLQTLSRNPVIVDMFDEPKTWEVQHIALADKADLFMIIPATANFLGKVANGIADDMLTTTVMATKGPVLIAPAMNVNMYSNPIVQENIAKLRKLGYYFVEPDEGMLACGYEGKGRLAGLDRVIAKAHETLNTKKDLLGKKVLVTAGGTREAIDPVRYISNHSSGKMGYAIAQCAVARGAEVYLVSGPTALDKPSKVNFIAIESALEMYNEVHKLFPEMDIVIKAAAVADYKPKIVAEKKIKKLNEELTIELEKNPDILLSLGKIKSTQVLVGFAAETNDLVTNAKDKIKRKNLDFIVANDVTQAGAGFGTDTNIIKIIYPNGNILDLPIMTKKEVANIILDKASNIFFQNSK